MALSGSDILVKEENTDPIVRDKASTTWMLLYRPAASKVTPPAPDEKLEDLCPAAISLIEHCACSYLYNNPKPAKPTSWWDTASYLINTVNSFFHTNQETATQIKDFCQKCLADLKEMSLPDTDIRVLTCILTTIKEVQKARDVAKSKGGEVRNEMLQIDRYVENALNEWDVKVCKREVSVEPVKKAQTPEEIKRTLAA